MESKDVVISEYTVLECLNSESSISEVRWYKNSKAITQNDKRYLLTQGNHLLIIAKTIEDDAGLYTCEMENNLGKEKLSIKLTVRSEQVPANDLGNYTRDEITAIIIVTVVCCAIGTSIVWIVIIYQTKKDNGCSPNSSIDGDGIENHLNKSGILSSVHVSMLPKGDIVIDKPLQSMRTATISHCRGVLRSNSGSSCEHSSIGVGDDIFRSYKDNCSMNNTLLHPKNRNGLDSEEDDANNDHEALLGANYYARYPNTVKCSDNDSFITQMQDDVDGNVNQHDSSAGNTSTAECVDDDDNELHLSLKTKTSTSLSSSCHSIPALPLNSSHEYDLNRSHCNKTPPNMINHSNESKPMPNKPIPFTKIKPNIHTNKLNELMSTFK